MKLSFLLVLLSLLSSFTHAKDLAECEGSVLERRLALVQFGKTVDAYITTHGELPNICSVSVSELDNAVPLLLQNALLCGSTEEKAVYYSCVLIQENHREVSKVIERCSYSLSDQTMGCENKSLVTVIE